MSTFPKKAILTAALLCAGAPVWAQTYPAHPVKVIFPYPPGTADVVLRAVVTQVEKTFGQSVVIDYRTGGNEVPAAQAGLSAAADGYTVLTVSQNFSLNPAMQKLPYEQSQFLPITQYASFSTPIAVRADFPANNMAEFIAYAKANPGKLNFGYVGNFVKISVLLLADRTGVKFTDIPFRGGADIQTALYSNSVDVYFPNGRLAIQERKAGKIKILGHAGLQRWSELPDVPTIAETVPGYSMIYWLGFVVRQGTPRAPIDRWNSAVREAVKNPEALKVFQSQGWEPTVQSPEQFGEVIKRETDSFARTAKNAGIVPE